MNPKSNTIWVLLRWIMPLLFIGLLLVHANYYMPFLADDALISLRYADRLIHGGGLTWSDGQPVEGYSNLMWILLVSLLGSLGTDLVVVARILGCLCMCTVIAFAGCRYLTHRRQASSLFGFAVGMLFFVGAAPIAVWAIGGLEQPLVAASLAGAILLYWIAADGGFKGRLQALALSIPLGVLCLTRPDGPLFTVAVVASALFSGILIKTKQRRLYSFAMIVVSVPILSYGGQLGFRLAYYNEWLPNTALVKLTPSSHHLAGGLEYVWQGVLSLAPASFLAFVFLGIGVFHRASRERSVLLLSMLLLWLGYLAVIGGDIFPAYRHFVPAVVLLAYALAEGTTMVWDRLVGGTVKHAIFAVILIVITALTIPFQFGNTQNQRAITERWEWNGRSLALTLRDAFSEERPVLAVTAAGCLPYWSELPCLDMLGLNDYYLPRHKPKGVGTGILGHELGDGDYVLQCAPDLIVFNVGSEPAFRSGSELNASREFHLRYARMRLRTAYPPEYTAQVWFSIKSSKIGYVRDRDHLTIPAYFLNAFDSTISFLDHGRLRVAVDAAHPVGVVLARMPNGCEVTVVSPHSEEIECKMERDGNDVLIVLTTQKATPLPIDAIVIAESRKSLHLAIEPTGGASAWGIE